MPKPGPSSLSSEHLPGLWASPRALSISRKAPVCRCHFPPSLTTRHKPCCLCCLKKRKRHKKLSPNLCLLPFLKARYRLCLVLPECSKIVSLLLTISPGLPRKQVGFSRSLLPSRYNGWQKQALSFFALLTDITKLETTKRKGISTLSSEGLEITHPAEQSLPLPLTNY